ncbi:MAG TPA: Txe/YoeB family addiction module toxin [Bacteroidales bacterium]|nr:MAG: toxin YoeB [Bacteroidetes bacterium GWF2_35_48]OFY99518.1 MAG: toxin YoeB [Bacteroidetes bacterium RIFOXYC12_FULL_35_7]HBX53231.1 Txe/YoeB family addiction module toxin [Bacteroidales bacterium]
MRETEFTPTALQQLNDWEKDNISVYQKIEKLIQAIHTEPYHGIGKPEPLKHQLQGYWSRRINKEHRLVYKVTITSVIVISCKYHY